MKKIIHNCDWGANSDVRIACDQSYTQAAWKQPQTFPNVHLTDDNRYYTFIEELITCKQCLNQLIIKDIIE